MAGETVITVVGNLTADPEIRTIGSGAAVASFTIASTPRTWNRNSNQFEDGQALFLRCSAWRDMAEHCAQSLSKGMRVIATGRLSQRSYQAQDGTNRTVVEMTVDEIGPSLRYATAQVTRTSSGNGQGGFAGRGNGGNGRILHEVPSRSKISITVYCTTNHRKKKYKGAKKHSACGSFPCAVLILRCRAAAVRNVCFCPDTSAAPPF